MQKIKIFDSTLRDGGQTVGISWTIEDKIKVVKKLDELGIDYIEAGNPGSSIKDKEFFKKIANLKLKNAKIVSFGRTRKKNNSVENDENIKEILESQTPVVSIFGKSSPYQITKVLNTTLDENLAMISDSIKYLKSFQKEVIFCAEHFFDGYKENQNYSLKLCEVVENSGADVLVLCDTNGATMLDEIQEICIKIRTNTKCELGIHTHNDCGLAVATSLIAVKSGITHVQGTINGIGERTGNANLSTIIPDLQLKMGYNVLQKENLLLLTEISRVISEVSNENQDFRAPFVGKNAFSHKGGMHIDGVLKDSKTFEHINPQLVGNNRFFVLSDQAGRTLLLKKIEKLNLNLDKNSTEAIELLKVLKDYENKGWTFEEAEASFEIIVRKHLSLHKSFFKLKHFKVSVEEPHLDNKYSAVAVVKVEVDGTDEIAAGEGNGPVNALDKALRKALKGFYPELSSISLTDYKVRIINTAEGTAAKVRVILTSTDGKNSWTTVGVSQDIIEASYHALVDSIEYKLLNEQSK